MRPTDANWTRAILEHPGWKDVSCVAIPNVHWCDGSAVDLATIGKFCRDTRKALVIDGTQSIGAVPFNVLTPHTHTHTRVSQYPCPYTHVTMCKSNAHPLGNTHTLTHIQNSNTSRTSSNLDRE
eukprot:c12446_g2_i7.p1 GENE.c12446_g2_i7~~c12446_g2_i7.p1  ORF type:complete len:124 (+),score=27.61 c12446_g2_i7:544-915(+)